MGNSRHRMTGWCAIALLTSLIYSADGLAHRTHYALTELVWQVDQQNLEVVHQVHLDDAVVLLAMLGDHDASLDQATELELLAYLADTFSLELQGRRIPLTAVGAQIVGDNLWIFQETELAAFPQGLRVRTNFLFDYFPNQTQQVNLIIGSQVETLLLDRQTHQGQF